MAKPVQYSRGTELLDGKAFYKSPEDGYYYVYRRHLDTFKYFSKNIRPSMPGAYQIDPPKTEQLRPDVTGGAGAPPPNLRKAKLKNEDLDTYNGLGGLGAIEPGPLTPATTGTIRYPEDKLIDDAEDYVLFEFVKYNPPFGKDSATQEQRGAYNASVSNETLESVKVDIGDGVATVILPIPQDLSNEMKQNWEGKSFSGVGKAAIGALSGANLSFADTKIKDLGNNLKALAASLKTSALNQVPGVGGNLSINDLTGSTRGIVLNPNAELLYDSPDLREIGMTFKMVPRSDTEAQKIKTIVNSFRSASLPQWGSGGADKGLDASFNDVTFISVPLLCKFTFMHGPDPHAYIAQFKPCAIKQVQVNYTPDGTYATYGDSAPVATELSLQFVETKLIYASEIKAGF